MDSNDANNTEEVVSLQEVLEQEEYLTEAAQCLLGSANDEKCSYDESFWVIALVICDTCVAILLLGLREKAALIFVPYITWNFTPNGIFAAIAAIASLGKKLNACCNLYGSFIVRKEHSVENQAKDALNEMNTYNQNFQGIYCTCRRPYSDAHNPENDDDPMVQCIVCED